MIIALAVVRVVLPSFRSGVRGPEVLILAGTGIILAGAVPFIAYFYAPLGAGDRFNLTSAFGGLLVWVGAAQWLARWRWAVLAAVAALVAITLPTRFQRQELWTTAAGDAKRVAAAISQRFPSAPPEPVVLGPSPVQQQNVAALLDQSNVTGMLRYLYGRDVPGGIAYSRSDYERFPPEQRIDLWSLSRLRPDVDLSTDRQGLPVTPSS